MAQAAFPWDFLTGNNKRYIFFLNVLVMIIKSIFKQMSNAGALSSCLKPLTETQQSYRKAKEAKDEMRDSVKS